jgi:anti-sigma factor RsiW
VETDVTCRGFARFLSEYVDDELPSATRRQFESHLAGCPDCVAYLRQHRDAIRLIATAGAGELSATMPPDLVHAILAAARTASPRR